VLALAVVAVGLAVRSPADVAAPVMPLHFSLRFDPSDITPPSAAISPDGLNVAFTGRLPGAVNSMIFLRSLHEAVARPVAGSEDTTCCITFSPDSRWIAFVAGNRALKKVPVEGGTATRLVEGNFRFSQPAWTDNGKILLTEFNPERPGVIYELPESGGTPTPVSGSEKHADTPVFFPRALPAGRAVLLTIMTDGQPTLAVQSLDTGERHVLAEGARFARPVGRSLVWMDDERLMAAPFDPARLVLTGTPVTVPIDGLGAGDIAAVFDVSNSGSLLFMAARAAAGRRAGGEVEMATAASVAGDGSDATGSGLVWIDRQGTNTRVALRRGDLSDPRLSPDGTHVAAEAPSGGGDPDDVWAIDLRRGGVSRLSFGDGEDETAVWSPDSAWIAWASSRAGARRALYRRRSDGSGHEEKLWVSDGQHFHAQAWTPDGTGILVSVDDPKTGWDVMLVTLGPTPVVKPLLTGPFNEMAPRISPDGRWIVYASDESGREEIYAQAFPGLGRRVQISVDGGTEPIWHPRGGEIVFRAASARQFMSVSVEAADSLVLSAPRPIASDDGVERASTDHTSFDVAPDGRLLAVEEPAPDYRRDMHVILGWAQAAKLLP
jgi:Tol biopolymer transport system component